MSRKAAYTTLLTNNKYLPGVIVLRHGLRASGTKYPLVVMTVPETPESALQALHRQRIQTRQVAEMKLHADADGPDIAAHDARFHNVWTKLRAFSLTEYERVVMLDSDMLICKNMDYLLEMDLPQDSIAAAHVCACNPWKLKHYPEDWIPENCAHTSVRNPTDVPVIQVDSPRPYTQLNSGTVVLNPSAELDAAIENFMKTSPLLKTWTFPDQDLLSAFFFGKWKVLPWYYNSLITLSYIHQPMWCDDEIRCLHYIGYKKPWAGRKSAQGWEPYQQYIDWWWNAFDGLESEIKESDPETWRLLTENTTPGG